MQLPSCALWKMVPGSWAEYQKRAAGTADYNQHTGEVFLRSGAWPVEATFRITNLPFQISAGRWGIARVYGNVGQVVTAVDLTFNNVLFEEAWSGGPMPTFIGEAANVGSYDIAPPEPLLTIAPKAAELFTVPSTARNVGSAGEDDEQFTTQYYTRAVGITFGEAVGATWTCLVESPGVPGMTRAYNQVFDGEIYQQWYGAVNPDNATISNAELLYRIGQGQNP